MKSILAIAGVVAIAGSASANIYDADFSVDVLIDHTTTGNALEASPQVGPNWTISYPSAPSSDTTLNFFGTQGGELVSSDFGGDHTWESDAIDVSSLSAVTWDVIGETVETPVNASAEFIEFYYSLDGGAQVVVTSFTGGYEGSLNLSELIDVSAASSLRVGLNANINGAGDGFAIQSITVVPTPGALALAGIAGFAGIRRRRA